MQRPAVSQLIFPFFAVLLAACDDSTEPSVPTTIHLQPAAVELEWGGSGEVTAEVMDQHGKRIDDWPQGFDLEWAIDDAAIAVVEGGIRTASIRSTFGDGGETILTVTADGIPAAQAAITALSAPDTIAGELEFQYQGVHSGTFSMEGSWAFDHQNPHVLGSRDYRHSQGGWVASHYDPEPDRHYIAATRVHANGWEDWYLISTAGRIVQPGTYEATGGRLYLGWRHVSTFSEVEGTYDHFGTGSLTITSAGPDHVTGTFDLILDDRSAEPWAQVEIEEGHFSAPLLVDRPADCPWC